MPLRSNGTIGALLLLSFVLLSFNEALSQDGVLEPLAGVWRVNGVRLDETLMRTPYYSFDDVRLIGRLMTFGANKIETDVAEGTACLEPKAEVAASTADALVASSMGRSVSGKAPTASNFELPINGENTVNVWWVTCNKGDIGPDTPFGPEDHNWIAGLTPDLIAMRWYDNTILVLQRLPHDAKPRPSFDCQRARTPSERQICTSVSLSSLDQSVTRAYTTLAKSLEALGEPGELKQLHKTQKKWLVERDKCGKNLECLQKTMHDRLEQLATHE